MNRYLMEREINSRKVTLGRSGIEAKRLGFGGIPIQRIDEAQAVETVIHALEKGIDFIDTSRAYSTSERRIGIALKKAAKRPTLATKSPKRTSDGIRSDIETSLKELQVDCIDLYQCHFVRDEENYKKVISPGGALEGLTRAREEGLIRHIGITSHSLRLLSRIIDDNLFETIMVCFSFLEPAAQEEVIPKAMEKDIGVIAMKPLSGGLIDRPDIALKYALSQEGILVLVGVEHKELFDQNWRVYQRSYRLSEREKRQIEEIRTRYDKVFCRRCDYCQPCSEEIPIQLVLGIRSMVKRMGKRILVESPRKDAIEKARSCSECGECLERCPYGLPIPDLIKENIRWVDQQIQSY